MNLKCISLNIRGINKAIKRRNLFRWLHNGKYDVIFLQETYSDKTIENVWRAEWGGDIFHSHGSKHSRGVMTLTRPTVKGENISTTCDRNGRVLIVNLTIQDGEFCLANIYAPNDQNLQVDFYTQLTRKLRPYVNSNLVLGGDFNCPLENIDKKGGKDISSSMYADDLTAFIKDERSASQLFSLLNDFGTCSGLKINCSKTEGMWLGKPEMPLGQTRSI